MRQPGAGHAGRLGDVDRGDPADDLLVLVDLDLLASGIGRLLAASGGSRAARGSVGIPKL
jgi:hypothetical protein